MGTKEKVNLLLFQVAACFFGSAFGYEILEILEHRPAVLVAQLPDGHNETLCSAYYPNITTLPEAPSEKSYRLLDLTPWDACSPNVTKSMTEGYIAIISRGNCSLGQRTMLLKDMGASGIVVVTPKAIRVISNESYTDNFVVFLINPNTKEKLVRLGRDIKISLYSPSEDSYWDYSLLVIFILAVGTVAAGSYWSGIVRYDLTKPQPKNLGDRSSVSSVISVDTRKEEVSVILTPCMVAVFVMSMIFMLMLLYWFFSYLVYVIITLFAFASATAVYQCIEPLLAKANCLCCRAELSCFNKHFRVNQILLFLFACTVSSIWVAFRREPWAWILQDILGVAFSVNMLKLIRLPNFKICTILLVLLFFYDIFFVFITPFFTKNGESIMVEVASGGASGGAIGGNSGIGNEEQLPMVLRVPHLGYQPFGVCYERFSLLGFGDILVPGLLVSFCHYFDLKMKTPFKIYFVSSLIAYAGGLAATFIGLFMMGMAQPALLYLVPFTLITVSTVALSRKEFKLIWKESETQMSILEDGSIDQPSPTYGTAQTTTGIEQENLVKQ